MVKRDHTSTCGVCRWCRTTAVCAAAAVTWETGHLHPSSWARNYDCWSGNDPATVLKSADADLSMRREVVAGEELRGLGELEVDDCLATGDIKCLI